MEAQAAAHHFFWTWMKRPRDGTLMNYSFGGDYSSSWDQEKAFAEDRASLKFVGGCIWPPRSYSCSFCRREFKSAQALGGHMNVHRRDRAKAKLQNHHSLFPHYNATTTNPKSPSLNHHSISSPRNSNDNANVVAAAALPSPPPLLHIRVSAAGGGAGTNDHEDYYCVETSLSVGLKPNMGCDDELAIISCKRKKTTLTTSNSAAAVDDDDHEFSLQKDYNLDLELRLGDAAAPKVK